MNESAALPPNLEEIEQRTRDLKFDMASDRLTGALLCALTASKPGGRLLELGTGTGLSAAWMLMGMDDRATLDSVDVDPQVQAVAREFLGDDLRLTLHTQDGNAFLEQARAAGRAYDLIFADAMPGKYEQLDRALALLPPGGLYVIDDMNPQPNWPPDHAPRVKQLIATLDQRDDLVICKMNWSTGIIIGTSVG